MFFFFFFVQSFFKIFTAVVNEMVTCSSVLNNRDRSLVSHSSFHVLCISVWNDKSLWHSLVTWKKRNVSFPRLGEWYHLPLCHRVKFITEKKPTAALYHHKHTHCSLFQSIPHTHQPYTHTPTYCLKFSLEKPLWIQTVPNKSTISSGLTYWWFRGILWQ